MYRQTHDQVMEHDQHTIAISSGEAELYAMVKGAAQTKGLMSMIQGYDIKLDGRVRAQMLLQHSA